MITKQQTYFILVKDDQNRAKITAIKRYKEEFMLSEIGTDYEIIKDAKGDILKFHSERQAIFELNRLFSLKEIEEEYMIPDLHMKSKTFPFHRLGIKCAICDSHPALVLEEFGDGTKEYPFYFRCPNCLVKVQVFDKENKVP